MRFHVIVLVLLASLLTFTPEVTAQPSTSTDVLRGQVTDPAGRPIAQVRVEARSLTTGAVREARTGADGRFTIVVPEGGGRYRVTFALVGMEGRVSEVSRIADEEVLIVSAVLTPVVLDPISVQARRAPPGQGEAGSQYRTFSQDVTRRLPLQGSDPNSLATLVAGVLPADRTDSLNGGGGFSAAGQRASQNSVTLDGTSFAAMLSGGGFAALPSEGLRSTRVITSTWDVSRGQFSGALVAMESRAGTNARQGSVSYQGTSDLFSGGAGRGPWRDGYLQNGISGGIGGPIRRDRLFYNVSVTAQRRSDGLFALQPRSPAGFALAGVHADSVERVLSILSEQYGIQQQGKTGGFDRVAESLGALGRIDFAPTSEHSLSLRAFGSGYWQSNALVLSLDMLNSGARVRNTAAGVALNGTSRLGQDWVNEFRIGYNEAARSLSPLSLVPEARIQIASDLPSGSRGIASVAAGGEPQAPTSSEDRLVEVANELSRLVGETHRLKVGGLLTIGRSRYENAALSLGSFTFNSVADLERGVPASFSRRLESQTATGSGWDAAFYAGDVWRPIARLQLTYGLRVEGSGYGAAPVYRALADSAFGIRTDAVPRETAVSPRAGFSWRLSNDREPLRLVRGGVGEFRGRTPFSLYTDILESSRDPQGRVVLYCAGAGHVPVPDFRAYAENQASIPSSCSGEPSGEGGAAPSIAAFSRDFGAPRSRRASLGFIAQIRGTITGSVDVTYARGRDQFGVRDLNLRADPAFSLPEEGQRPVYAPAAALSVGTGLVGGAASRIDPRFANVFEVHSGLESEFWSMQLQVNGILPSKASFQGWYTLTRARDQSSFPSGTARQGFASVPTGGNPNEPKWSVSDLDRRHSVTVIAGIPQVAGVNISVVTQATSGAPYTPRVGGDANADGLWNDAAYIFDPATARDPAVATAMSRMLESAPGRVRECLTGQLGRVAERNSCRGPWSYSVDLRAEMQPRIPRLGRRVALAVDLFNLPGAADFLIHGAAGLHGWGRGSWGVDQTLLYTRGFDAGAPAYRYAVNEQFGQSLAQRFSSGSPFTIYISAQVALGAEPRPDPYGGFSSLGFGSEPITVNRTARVAAPQQPDVDALLNGMLPEPVERIMALRETLGLGAEQLDRLNAIRDSLHTLNAPIRAEVRRALLAPDAANNLARVYQAVGSRINEGRRNVQNALDQVRTALRPEQWDRVPVDLRNAVAASIQ